MGPCGGAAAAAAASGAEAETLANASDTTRPVHFDEGSAMLDGAVILSIGRPLLHPCWASSWASACSLAVCRVALVLLRCWTRSRGSQVCRFPLGDGSQGVFSAAD